MEKFMIKTISNKTLEEGIYRREYMAADIYDFGQFLILLHNIDQYLGKPRIVNNVGRTEINTGRGHIWPSVVITVKGSKDVIDFIDEQISNSIEDFEVIMETKIAKFCEES